MYCIHNMEIFNIIILILVCIILTIYFFQFKYFSKQNQDLIILQKNNPDKELIEDMIDNKSPTIFTGMIENWQTKDDKNITKQEYDKNTQIFNIPLCIVKKYKQLILPEDKKTKIIKEKSNRSLFFLLEGEIRLFLFSPKENLENIKDSNFFDEPEKFKDVKYLEIKFSEGHIIYIPRGWSYCYKVGDYTEILTMNCESIFSLPHSVFTKP